MATIKSHTDLSQSKKLAEILPLESADMYLWSSGKRYYIEAMDDGDFNEEEGHVRAWSLAALLGVLPQSITKYIEGESCQKTFHLNLFRSYYHCVSYSFTPSVNDDNTLYCIGRDNWVDACVAMIEKLNELNLL